jgi:hypothetical protein
VVETDRSEALIRRNHELTAFAAEAMVLARQARAREVQLASRHVRAQSAVGLERARAVALPLYLPRRAKGAIC